MKKICNICGDIFPEIYGFCLECGSDDCELISEEDICVVCNGYHDTGLDGKYKGGLEKCFNKIYRDGRAWKYINENWDADETDSNFEWLNEPYTKRTFRDMMWTQDTAEIKAFMQFAADCESAEQERIDLKVSETRKAG